MLCTKKTSEFLIFNKINHCETSPQSLLQPLTFIFIFILVYFIATVFILGFNGDRDIHNDSYNAFYLNNKMTKFKAMKFYSNY